jgi:hypothetical protein
MRRAKEIHIRFWLFLTLWLIASSAQSELVNVEPNVWRDTDTNLEWLSLRLTTSEAMGLTTYGDTENLTTAGALLAAVGSSHYVTVQGFSIAATSEVSSLYTNSLGVYGGAGPFNPDIWQLGETEAGVDVPVFDLGGAIWTGYQSGLHYADGAANLRSSYLVREYGMPFGEPLPVSGGTWSVADTAVTTDMFIQADDGCANCGGYGERGVYLVRSVVPVPPAIWLFGSALVALLGRRRSLRS